MPPTDPDHARNFALACYCDPGVASREIARREGVVRDLRARHAPLAPVGLVRRELEELDYLRSLLPREAA